MRQTTMKLSEYIKRNAGGQGLTCLCDVVCDFPLPCSPHMNAEKGIFVSRKSLGSTALVEHVPSFGKELPSSPYCGRRLRLQCCQHICGKENCIFDIELSFVEIVYVIIEIQ